MKDFIVLLLTVCAVHPLPKGDVDIDIYKSCDVLSLCLVKYVMA